MQEEKVNKNGSKVLRVFVGDVEFTSQKIEQDVFLGLQILAFGRFDAVVVRLQLGILFGLVVALGFLELVDDDFLLLGFRDVLVALSHVVVEQHLLLLYVFVDLRLVVEQFALILNLVLQEVANVRHYYWFLVLFDELYLVFVFLHVFDLFGLPVFLQERLLILLSKLGKDLCFFVDDLHDFRDIGSVSFGPLGFSNVLAVSFRQVFHLIFWVYKHIVIVDLLILLGLRWSLVSFERVYLSELLLLLHYLLGHLALFGIYCLFFMVVGLLFVRLLAGKRTDSIVSPFFLLFVAILLDLHS